MSEDNNIKALIVDDSEDNIFLMKSILRVKFDFEIQKCLSAEEALDLIQNDHYSFVLLDMTMPGMDGYELLKLLREKEEDSIKNLPVVAVTANAMSEDRQLCLDAGASEYLSKPIDMEKLYDLVNLYIKN